MTLTLSRRGPGLQSERSVNKVCSFLILNPANADPTRAGTPHDPTTPAKHDQTRGTQPASQTSTGGADIPLDHARPLPHKQ